MVPPLDKDEPNQPIDISTTYPLQRTQKPNIKDGQDKSPRGQGLSLRFINHDAKTLGTETFLPEIKIHIQKYSWRHVRRQKPRNLKWHQKNAVSVRPLHASLSGNRKEHPKQPSGSLPAATLIAREQSPELTIVSIGSSLDPFHILVSDNCPWLAETLDYCMNCSRESQMDAMYGC